MKKILLITAVILSVVACNNDPRVKLPQTGNFGTAFDTANAMNIADVETILNMTNHIGLKATGTVAQYCKGEGCWLTLKNENGEAVWVEVKDKAFVLPYNIDGKTAFVNGTASFDTTEDGKERIKIVADGIVLQ
jgi:uncharacterized lipoprotein NlpE involved in copper resistance